MRRKKRKQSFELYKGNIESLVFKPLFFIDFEYITTSYRVNKHREHLQEIIEIAGIIIKDDGIACFDKIVKPKFFLKQMCSNTELSKITYDELLKGIDFSKAIYIFRDYYKPGVTKIISWGGSDLYNMNHLCKIHGIQFHIRKDDYIDLSQKFKKFYNLNQAITLEKALIYVNIKEKFEKHRALPDTEMLLRLFDKMVEDGYIDVDLVKEI